MPEESYGFENRLSAWETIPPLVEGCSPLRTAHLRDPVGPELHFASESFIDELAAAARDKFGGDAIQDFVAAHAAYLARIPWTA